MLEGPVFIPPCSTSRQSALLVHARGYFTVESVGVFRHTPPGLVGISCSRFARESIGVKAFIQIQEGTTSAAEVLVSVSVESYNILVVFHQKRKSQVCLTLERIDGQHRYKTYQEVSRRVSWSRSKRYCETILRPNASSKGRRAG